MKTLGQVEARTPISSAPTVISEPGAYYLTTNLVIGSGDAIVIATNGVTLDLNGFTISSTAPGVAGSGILLYGGVREVMILNGAIRGCVTNNGSGVFSGNGFGSGITHAGGSPQNVIVRGVTVSGCLYDGIYLGHTGNTIVDGCSVRTVGGIGILASIVRGSIAAECGSTGIFGRLAADCRGQSVASGSGVQAEVVQNCIGESVSGVGVYSTQVATGCYALSTSGLRALFAVNASFCVASRSGGRAIEATIANGCYATAGTNLIAYKYNMP